MVHVCLHDSSVTHLPSLPLLCDTLSSKTSPVLFNSLLPLKQDKKSHKPLPNATYVFVIKSWEIIPSCEGVQVR